MKTIAEIKYLNTNHLNVDIYNISVALLQTQKEKSRRLIRRLINLNKISPNSSRVLAKRIVFYRRKILNCIKSKPELS